MKKVIISDEAALKGILPMAGEDVVLMRDGHAVALVSAFDDDDLDWYAQEHDPAFIDSIRQAREQIASGQSISHEELKHKLGIQSTTELLEDLTGEQGALTTGAAEHQIPSEPGFYSIFVDDPHSLPDDVGEHLGERKSNLIYLGIASKSLRQRLVEQDLRHKGPSSFFRTLGALLGHKPQPGSLRNKANRNNYFFPPSQTRQIVAWIDQHVRVKWLVAHHNESELEKIEERLIFSKCPVLNLKHNPHKKKSVKMSRDQCRKIARGPADAA